MTCLLFSHASAHPRDLHSFPTRRSSDLSARAGARLRGIGAHRQARRARSVARAHQCGTFRAAAADGKDRKSTRLNSSHRCISYAVFCLKKKKITKKITTKHIKRHKCPTK